jgi:hypothetical protein
MHEQPAERAQQARRHENGKAQQRRPEAQPVDPNQLPAFLMRPINLPKLVEKPAVRPMRKKKEEDAEA